MNEATDKVLTTYRLAVCKVKAMIPLFIQQVHESEFGMPWRATAVVALAERAKSILAGALTHEEDPAPYEQAGEEVAGILWGIGEQLQDVLGEDRSDLCWGLLDGMEELLKSAGLLPTESQECEAPNMPNAIAKLPGQHGRRGQLMRSAGCAISDLATALTTLMDRGQTAELTLIRRIEDLSGVVISAAEEDNTDMQYLERLLTRAT